MAVPIPTPTPGPTPTPTAPTPTPVTEEAATRKFASAGWEGIFKVSTRLLTEKEIDIDDREAKILFTLEMDELDPWEFKLDNIHVVLKVIDTAPNQNISINGVTLGDVVVIDEAEGVEIFPGAALHRELTIKTGAFSSAAFTANSAIEGLKQYEVEISYALSPFVENTDNTTRTQLVFYVASD